MRPVSPCNQQQISLPNRMDPDFLQPREFLSVQTFIDLDVPASNSQTCLQAMKHAKAGLTTLAIVCFARLTIAATDPAHRPNILFAIADDMEHASAYGTRWVHTPSFDPLSQQ